VKAQVQLSAGSTRTLASLVSGTVSLSGEMSLIVITVVSLLTFIVSS
jgi:hypothetical protein